MPRRGENIYKRKDGRWEGRYAKSRHDGKIKYGYVYAKTYKEVKNKPSGKPAVPINTGKPQFFRRWPHSAKISVYAESVGGKNGH